MTKTEKAKAELEALRSSMTEAQFCACILIPAAIGWVYAAAYYIFVKGFPVDAVLQKFSPPGRESPVLYFRDHTAGLVQRHLDRKMAYAESGSVILTRMTPHQWMCAAVRPGRWGEQAFEVRAHFVDGAPADGYLRGRKTFVLAARRHALNILAYTPAAAHEESNS